MNAEISLTTSFLAQELLNELFVRALTADKLTLADVKLVNRCAQLGLPFAEHVFEVF